MIAKEGRIILIPLFLVTFTLGILPMRGRAPPYPFFMESLDSSFYSRSIFFETPNGLFPWMKN